MLAMKIPAFRPKEILFCPTTKCNLSCAHCDIKKNGKILSKKTAIRFLNECADAGIKRLGFTGGEPFLALDALCAVTKEAVRRNMTFSRIMTNGAWFKSGSGLSSALMKLFRAGYDGDICVSVDAFHAQESEKAALFIKTAIDIWNRPDIVSIAAVKGAREDKTRSLLKKIARLLNARVKFTPAKNACIRKVGLFIKIFYIDLSPVGRAKDIKKPWDGKWFKDDFCKGPGQVFFVLPDGQVKPCCGYANDSDILTIGSIKNDSPEKMIRNAAGNLFISKVFGKGLHPIRRAIERSGIRFPGKTTNHCFFCRYLTHDVPRQALRSALYLP